MKTTLVLPILACAVFTAFAADTAPKAPAPFSIQSVTRRISFKAKVDGSDDLIIQDGKLHIEHVDWERPAEMSVNGKKWKPVWNEKRSADFGDFVPVLALFKGATITVKQVRGRGDTVIRQEPNDTNGGKLVVRLSDSGGGASEFEVRITW